MVASLWREKLLNIQRKLYHQNLRLVRASLGKNLSIDRYAAQYRKYLHRYERISSKGELLKHALSSNIVYQGDYHSLQQSQHAVFKILREIADKKKLSLCVELFHASDQRYLDAYLREELDFPGLLKKSHAQKKWPFNWDQWRLILEFCQRKKIPVIGINSLGQDSSDGILSRDRFAAKIITKLHIARPDTLIYVIDGDYHVSPNHLPKEVDHFLGILDMKPRRTIIYQNAENLYWKLARSGHEEVDVLQIDSESFCLMNTLPANKIQSYLNWLDYGGDAYFPMQGDWEEGEPPGLSVTQMIELICTLLGLKISQTSLDLLSVHYGSDSQFLEQIEKDPSLSPRLKQIRDKLERGEGFVLEVPNGNKGNLVNHRTQTSYDIYLPNASLNMAAEEAAHFVNLALRGPLRVDLAPFDLFYRCIMTECLGFFGSKLINEKRKAPTEHSLRVFLGQIRKSHLSPKLEAELNSQLIEEEFLLARSMLQHFHLDRQGADSLIYEKKFTPLINRAGEIAVRLATQVGYVLGNKLYYGMKRGIVSISELQHLFVCPFDEPRQAFEHYQALSHALINFNPPTRL